MFLIEHNHDCGRIETRTTMAIFCVIVIVAYRVTSFAIEVVFRARFADGFANRVAAASTISVKRFATIWAFETFTTNAWSAPDFGRAAGSVTLSAPRIGHGHQVVIMDPVVAGFAGS
jgi:hypothetical protein